MTESMNIGYMCARFAADENHTVAEHIEIAVAEAQRLAQKYGIMMVVPHTFFAPGTPDRDRERIMKFCIHAMHGADLLFVKSYDEGISSGMIDELDNWDKGLDTILSDDKNGEYK